MDKVKKLADAVKFLLNEYDSLIENDEVYEDVDYDDMMEVREEIAKHVEACDKILEG